MNESPRRIYRFGNVEVDPSKGCLRRGGQEQYLRAKTFQVLIYLLEHRDRLVTKQELMEHIWADTFVTDGTLVNCIAEIRKALSDDSRDPHFLKTISKAGYRFIGAVEEISLDEPATVQMEKFTSVEIEIEEEITNGRAGEWASERPRDVEIGRHGDTAMLPPPRVAASPRRRVVVVSALARILMAVVAVTIYLSQRPWRSHLPQADVTLPQVPGKKPLVVMYFENQSGSRELDWLRAGLADMLITDLSRAKKLAVLSRQQLHLLLERVGHAQANPIQLDEALEMARRSQAQAIVLGSFATLGEKVRLDVQLHDAHTGHLLAAEGLTADKVDQIPTQVDLLSLRLAAHLGAAPTDQDTKRGLADAMTDNLEAYRFYSLAVDKAQAYHNAEAIALLEKAIALDPQFAMAYARIGYAYAVTQGFADKAKPYLEKAFHLSGRLTDKDKLYIAAWYAIANLDYPGAIRSFWEIITQYPLEIEAYWRLGRLLPGEEQYEEAIGVLKRGLVIDPEAKDIYNGLGGIYSDLGRHDDAIGMYQRYVALVPEEPNAHDSLGMGYQWAGRYEQAMQEYNRALELNPEFDIAIVHLGNVYFQLGRYWEAIHQYQRYIQIAPSDLQRARGYGCLAHVYWQKGDLDHAEAAATKELRDDKRSVWNSLIIALARGDRATAEKLKAQLFMKSPYTGRGARFPLRRTDDYARGYLALKEERTTEAIEHFKEALRHQPPIWDIDSFEDCLANAYLQLDRLDEAIAEYERILRINPNYPLAHYHLGQAYERKGQRERERAEYERFLQIWKDADPDLPEVMNAKHRLANQHTP